MDYLKIQSNQTILVLNASYEPLHLTNWKRAVVLLLKNKAQILSKRVIRLLNYVRIPLSKLINQKPSRSMIYARDGNKCQYCGATRNLTIDHVIPSSKGGDNSWENLTCACYKCNTKKGDKLLEDTDMKLAKKPRAPISKTFLQISSMNNEEWNEYVFQ
jgi:hypothetical protein